MKKIISALILASLLSSCATRRACERRFTDARLDSTNTQTVIRDTTIYVYLPGDTVLLTTPIDEVSRIYTALATSTAWIKDGKFSHRLEQKDTTVPATIKGALKTTHKTSITRSQKERTIQQTRYANQLTWWQWTQVYLGRIFLGVLVVILLWKVMNTMR